jgi:uncharacterized protein
MRRFSAVLLLAALTNVSAGCSFGRQQPTRFYNLTSLSRAEALSQSTSIRSIAIGVGPVELPQYTNRPQIVTGGQSTEIYPAQFAHWAEPLRENFTRVLAENLSTLLATDRVTLYPWKGPLAMDYQIIVEVTQFLGEPGGTASLASLWSVVGKNGKEVLISKKSVLSESTGSQDYEALASTMSKLVTSLSREIAATVAQLSRQPIRP